MNLQNAILEYGENNKCLFICDAYQIRLNFINKIIAICYQISGNDKKNFTFQIWIIKM